MGAVKVGEVATLLGVQVHVLHHWDAVGVVVPDRTASGHRVYTDEHLRRLRILRSCQDVGMSLAEVRVVLHRQEPGRAEVIRRRLVEIERQRRELDRAQAFLEHVISCRHGLMSRCPACSSYPPDVEDDVRAG